MAQVAYKYRIYPTKTQEKQLSVFFGQVRFVWNYSLSLRSDLYEHRKESINYVRLGKHLTYLKKQESHAWLNECPSAPLTVTHDGSPFRRSVVDGVVSRLILKLLFS